MELKAGYKITEVGVIPEDWSVDFLDHHSRRGTGHTPNKKVPEYYEGAIVWISLADSDNLDSGEISASKITVSKLGILNSSAVLHPKGTVLMSRDASVGKSAVAGCELCVSQHFVTWVCNERSLHNWFLYYWLQYQKSAIERIAVGSTIKTIGLPFFQDYRIPIPPTKEQRAIAVALSDMDALIRTQDQFIAKKRDLKQAVIQQLLTGKQRLPGFRGKWEVKRLGNLGSFRKGRGIRKDAVVPEGIPCVRYGELYTHYNDYVTEFHSFIPREIAKQSQEIHRGDLLFAGSGETAEEIGKCVAFLGSEEAYAGGDIVVFTPANQDSLFLGYLMNHSSISSQKAMMGQGDAVVHISAGNLAQLEIRLPPSDEQTPGEQSAIAAVLCDIDAEIAALEQRRDKTRALKTGIMQELLTGRTRLV